MKLNRMCKAIYAARLPAGLRRVAILTAYVAGINGYRGDIFWLTPARSVRLWGIIIITLMPPNPHAKRKALQAAGTFNSRAAQVRHPLFQRSPFFDPEDLLQLKYETLRAVEVEKCPVAKAARDFGLSRPTIYGAHTQLQQQGLEGLLPHKRGPKAAHKLTDQVLQYVREQAAAQSEIKAEELARRVRRRFAVKLHPRTIQKALERKAKRGRST
jgi:transposase